MDLYYNFLQLIILIIITYFAFKWVKKDGGYEQLIALLTSLSLLIGLCYTLYKTESIIKILHDNFEITILLAMSVGYSLNSIIRLFTDRNVSPSLPAIKENNIIFHYNGSSSKTSHFEVPKSNARNGLLTVNGNVINITRNSSEGEYQLNLIYYKSTNSQFTEFIEKDYNKGGKRKIYVECDIKIANGGSQEIIFCLRDVGKKVILDRRKIQVSTNIYTTVKLAWTPSFDIDFQIKIISSNVITPTNVVQIKNLKVFEEAN